MKQELPKSLRIFSHILAALTFPLIILGFLYVRTASYQIVSLISQIGGELNGLLIAFITLSDAYWLVSIVLVTVSITVILKFRNTPTGVIANASLFFAALFTPLFIVEGLRIIGAKTYLPYLLGGY